MTQILRADRRRREVRRVLRRTGLDGAAARRPRDDREHVARVRRDVRLLPGRRRDAPLPAAHRAAATSASRSSRRTARRTRSGTTRTSPPTYSQVVELDLSTVEPSLAGPAAPAGPRAARARRSRRSSRRSRASASTTGTRTTRPSPSRSRRATRSRPPSPGTRRSRGDAAVATAPASSLAEPPGRRVRARRRDVPPRPRRGRDRRDHVVHEHVEPVGDGRRRACSRRRPSSAGLARKPWVKSSLAPGSKVVTEYYDKAGLTPYLEELGFHTVGYGCTTCIGNSGPLPEAISQAIAEGDLVVCAVLSGQPELRGADPPRGEGELPRVARRSSSPTRSRDGWTSTSSTEPLGVGRGRRGRLPLATSGRRPTRCARPSPARSARRCSARRTRTSSRATTTWRELPVPEGELFAWDAGVDVRAAAAVLRRDAARARQRSRTSSARAASSASATRSRPTTSRPPARSSRTRPAGRVPRRARRRAEGLQLVRLAPRQPRGDGARHVRERPPAEPARPRLRGDVDGAPALAARR